MLAPSQLVCRRLGIARVSCHHGWPLQKAGRPLPKLTRMPRKQRLTFICRLKAQQANPDGQVMKEVQESARVIDELVTSISKEILLTEAVAHVTDDPAETTIQEVVKEAVASRLDSLNSTFITVLATYARSAAEQGNHDIAGLLLTIHDEVVSRFSKRLPPAMQVLNAVLQAPDPGARLELIKRQTAGRRLESAVEGVSSSGDEELPLCKLDELEDCVGQLIDEMEEMPEIPDRQMLARLCLLREEILDLWSERASRRSSKRQEGSAAPYSQQQHKQREPQLNPRYKDPTYKEGEVSERPFAAGDDLAAGEFQHQEGAAKSETLPSGVGFDSAAKSKLRYGQRQQAGQGQGPAQEVSAELVDDGDSSDEDEGSDTDEEAIFGQFTSSTAAATPDDSEQGVQPPKAEPAGNPARVEEEGQEGGEDETAPERPFVSYGVVPISCATFLKELVGVRSDVRRRALLEKALRSDWEGAAPRRHSPKQQPAAKDDADAAYYEEQRQRLRKLAEGPDPERSRAQNLVRPGRFMQSLAAIEQVLLGKGGREGDIGRERLLQMLSQTGSGGGASEAALKRLEDIRKEALAVLMDIAGEKKSEDKPS